MGEKLEFVEIDNEHFNCDNKVYVQDAIVNWIISDVNNQKLRKGIIISKKDENRNQYCFSHRTDPFTICIEFSIDNPRNEILKQLSIPYAVECHDSPIETSPDVIHEEELKQIRLEILTSYPEVHFGSLSEDQKIKLVKDYIQNGEKAITDLLLSRKKIVDFHKQSQ